MRVLFLGFVFCLCSFGSVLSLGSYSVFLSFSWSVDIFLSSFSGRKSREELWIMLATQLIEARAWQEGRSFMRSSSHVGSRDSASTITSTTIHRFPPAP